MENKSKKTAAIIGGGAAGMMAAIALKESAGEKIDAVLFERNANLGTKVLVSGGGRCNVTTGIFDVRKVLENYPRGARFLMSAMFRFPPDKVMDWFESRGVKLKIEDDLRVFPMSNDGRDIVGALEKALKEEEVEIHFNMKIVEAGKEGEKFFLQTEGGKKFNADFLVLTTGGNAYKQTGSSGDGYDFAKVFGHSVTVLAPSLGAFTVSEPWVQELSGVTIKKASISLLEERGKISYERTGPFIFTHRGVSGPAVFALSSMAAYIGCTKEKPMRMTVNLFPDEKADALKNRFQRLIEENGKKKLVNFLDIFLPKSMCRVFAEIIGLQGGIVVGDLKKDQKQAILSCMQSLVLHVTGREAGDEFVTAGGINANEINPGTMESKICPGLFFAGEILDVDGFTGGFNLQAAWATGRLAGESVAERV